MYSLLINFTTQVSYRSRYSNVSTLGKITATTFEYCRNNRGKQLEPQFNFWRGSHGIQDHLIADNKTFTELF